MENVLKLAFDDNDTKVQKVLKVVNAGAAGIKKASTMQAGKKDFRSFMRSQKASTFKKQEADDFVMDENAMSKTMK